MKKEIAQNALTFLSRVELKGNEAEAFLQVKQAIIESIDKETDNPVEDNAEES